MQAPHPSYGFLTPEEVRSMVGMSAHKLRDIKKLLEKRAKERERAWKKKQLPGQAMQS